MTDTPIYDEIARELAVRDGSPLPPPGPPPGLRRDLSQAFDRTGRHAQLTPPATE